MWQNFEKVKILKKIFAQFLQKFAKILVFVYWISRFFFQLFLVYFLSNFQRNIEKYRDIQNTYRYDIDITDNWVKIKENFENLLDLKWDI